MQDIFDAANYSSNLSESSDRHGTSNAPTSMSIPSQSSDQIPKWRGKRSASSFILITLLLLLIILPVGVYVISQKGSLNDIRNRAMQDSVYYTTTNTPPTTLITSCKSGNKLPVNSYVVGQVVVVKHVRHQVLGVVVRMQVLSHAMVGTGRPVLAAAQMEWVVAPEEVVKNKKTPQPPR